MASETKSTTSIIAAALATGAAACMASAFAVPQAVGGTQNHFLARGAAFETLDSASDGPAPSTVLCTGLAAGLAVGLATGAKAFVTARRIGGSPVAEFKEQSNFAGGLVGAEYGGYGRHEFDPMGLASRYPEHLPWYREAEAKHGRISMLACVGLLVPDAIRIPLDTFESPDLNAINAHNKLIGPGLGDGPMWWLLLFCAAIESTRFKQLGLAFEQLTLQNAGDVGFGKGFLPKSQEAITAMQIKELKNGRLAMLGFSGAITQAVIWDTPHFPFVPN